MGACLCTSDYILSTNNDEKIVSDNSYILVDSYVMTHSYHIYVPRELIQLILDFFKDDEIWHPHNIEMMRQLKVTVTDTYIERYDTSNKWSHIFGNCIIKYGEIKQWKLKILKTNFNDVYAIFGIVDINEIDQVNNENEFTYSCIDAFAIYGYNGNKIGGDLQESIPFTKSLRLNDIITMELDMTTLNCTLKYWINNEFCGVAFENIDSNQHYKLAVAIHDQVAIELSEKKLIW